ncbi:hypothetical protein Caci_8576 [Catenulispora acidiphila DSM 44928]|uniref:Integral membrane protein n=2 Tax=Catenulispora TaxID=414878 RepID=C7PYS3_CATAD|nr:hypothetical protein Caci_8576 [Catenulispora acidiphila DSM 44928]
MRRQLRNAIALSLGALAAATIGMAPAMADSSPRSDVTTINAPAGTHRALAEVAPFPGTRADAAASDDAAAGTTPAKPLTLNEVMDNVRTWIIGLLSGLATVFVTVGGLRYLMAGGNEGEVMKAKGALRSAACGYGLAVLAPVLVDALKSMVGAS